MTTNDTLDSLSNTNIQSSNIILFVILGLFGLVFLLWFLFHNKKIPIVDKKEIIPPYRPNISHTSVTATEKPIVKPPIVIVPKTPPSKPKYIGYKPINIFEQTEPLKFPYVIMPKENCVIKFPQKGRSGRKGSKEDDFKIYLTKYFREAFQIYDDRLILAKGTSYEPDITFIDEEQGINIFLDIEIDEPYEGINDIMKRKATHFQFIDTNRNNAFKNRGWIVIRFAEIQVHQNPNGCCLFVADIISSINKSFKTPSSLTSASKVKQVPQWTKEEAEQMSKDKWREEYLGIIKFGSVDETEKVIATETELGEKTEDIVKDEPPITPPIKTNTQAYSSPDLIRNAMNSSKFVSFTYNGKRTIVKPNSINNGTLNAYCYIKNKDENYTVANILNPVIKQRPFTLEAKGTNIGIERITSIVNTAIQYNKFIRMRYTRAAWTTMDIDINTGELIYDVVTTAEESTRTISNVQLAINNPNRQDLAGFVPNENHITAYCHRRDAERMFRFDRIGELAILDL